MLARRIGAGRLTVRIGALVTPVLNLLAGTIVLAVAFAMDEAVSIGSALGVLLLLSAVLRFAMARKA